MLAQPPVIVKTIYGEVQGEEIDGVQVFRSIPFAAAPEKELRFAPPQPPQPWSTVKDVRPYATPCPQMKLLGPLLYGGEDCLQLSVYAPPATASLRPVLYWIYGGAYVVGDSEELGWYDGKNLVKSHPEMLVVAVNYRLGPLGFMALPGLEGSGSAALLDQVAGLEWVRDNIAAFGGDPAQVTIAGESAGSFSVAWHLASPRSAGLFHAAILESSSFDTVQFFQPLAEAVAFNSLYSTAIGCPPDPSAPPGTDTAQLACMRALPVDKVLLALEEALNPDWPCVTPGRCPPALAAAAQHLGSRAGRTLPALAPLMPWGPAVGSPLLPDLPLALVRSGNFNKVPILIGTNKNEGSIFIPVFPLISPGTDFPPRLSDIPNFVEHAYNTYDAALVRNLTAALITPAYSLAAYNNDTWAMSSDVLRDAFFACATRRAARALSAPGRAPSVHLYEFSYHLQWPEVVDLPVLGNYHTSELDFVFGNDWPEFIHVRGGGQGGVLGAQATSQATHMHHIHTHSHSTLNTHTHRARTFLQTTCLSAAAFRPTGPTLW